MDYTEKHIVESYTDLLEGLSPLSKIELIENLSKSLKAENKFKDGAFYQSFGAFASDKPAEDIIKDIKASRRFKKKHVAF